MCANILVWRIRAPIRCIKLTSEKIKMGSRIKTSFLFAKPSLTSGAARLLDLGGTFPRYNRSRSPKEADVNALYSDWYSVGYDIADAMNEFEEAQAVK